MNTYLKIIIPLGLGLLAAALNWYSYQAENRPVKFVRVTQPLKAGDTLDLSIVEACDVPLKLAETMTGTFLGFEEAPALAKPLPVRRALDKGELVLKSDLVDISRDSKTAIMYLQLPQIPLSNALYVGQRVELICTLKEGTDSAMEPLHLGPFRLARVGKMVLKEESTGESTNTIGIERPRDKDPQNTAEVKKQFEILEKVVAGQGEIHSFITYPEK